MKSEFIKNKKIYTNTKRGTYIILPLIHANEVISSKELNSFTKVDYKCEDLTLLIQNLCKNEHFVNRYRLELDNNPIYTLLTKFNELDNPINIKQLELFIFNHNLAFMVLFFEYPNSKAMDIYNVIQPGYLTTDEPELTKCVNNIISIINQDNELELKLYNNIYMDNKNNIKDSYYFHIGVVDQRFKDLETLDQLTLNLHKIVDCNEEFIDDSERDIAYTYGARDVQLKTYRWGCCIASQDTSYMYAVKDFDDVNLLELSSEDFELVMLVMYQKFGCLTLNDKLYEALQDKKKMNNISKLRNQVLNFKATATLSPTQISRWYNVCETYRHLVELNGVNEALDEIASKLELIHNDHMNRIQGIHNFIALVITLFGSVSFVASVVGIVDIIKGTPSVVLYSFIISSILMALTIIIWGIMLFKNNRRR